MKKIFNFFLYGNHNKHIYTKYKSFINEDNYHRLILISIAEFIFNIILYFIIKISTFKIIDDGAVMHLFNAILSLVYFLLIAFFLRKNKKFVTLFFYIYIIVGLLLYEMLGVSYYQGYNATILCIMYILYAMILLDKPHRVSIVLIIITFFAINHSYNVKPFDIATIDYLTLSVACFIAIITSYSEFNVRLEKIIYQKEIENQRDTDYLTKLKSRISTEKNIDDYLKNSKEINALLIIDLDNFKSVNDTYGHLKGDEVLKNVAKILKNNFREDDYISRTGGDEFLAFIPNAKNKEAIENKAKKLVEEIQKIDLDKVKIGASIGISYSTMKSDYKTLFTNADSAMYLAKNNGKSRIEVYNEEDNKSKKDRIIK